MSKNDDFRFLHYPLPPDVERRKARGDLAGAIRLIDRLLSEESRPELAARLRCERIRLERLPRDYPYSMPEAKEILRREWPDMTDGQFDALLDNGRIDWRYLNGEIFCHSGFLGSVRLYHAEAPGLAPEVEETVERDAMLTRMKAEGGLAARITLTATVAAREPAGGKLVQAWLPIPAPVHQQSQVEILHSTEGGRAAPDDAPQRTIYWESRERDAFTVTYRYLVRAPYVDMTTLTADTAQPTFFLEEEAPHIMFTPYLRDLCGRITARCTGPLEKARAIYDWVTEHIDYRYQPNYMQLDPIAELCARQRRGDCGVFSVLFITLCRIAGIPAKWQSGLSVKPDSAGCHDWAMFYVAPHGWLWADCSYGSGSRRRGEAERRAHYFGNLDPCRMAANHQFAAPLTPPDPAWRNDPTDNQLGEMAVDGVGLTSAGMERSVIVEEFEYLPY